MWTYEQSTGHLLHDDVLIGTGYAGIGAGKNDPASQKLHDVGPIPQGIWLIDAFYNSQQFGPVVAHLWPRSGTETFGRSGFLIHGDSNQHPGLASHGCIVMPATVRAAVRDSKDTLLKVVSGPT